MKVAKYFTLLLALTLFSWVVFIATQSGNFSVHQTFKVDSTPSHVFHYLENIKNWSDWSTLKISEGDKINIQLNGFPSAEIQTLKVESNQHIEQILKTQTPTHITWSFKEVGNQTEVSFEMHGTIDFKTKFMSFRNGDASQIVQRAISINIEKLSNLLNHVFAYHEYETLGPQLQSPFYYIYTTHKTSLESLDLDLLQEYPVLNSFVNTNELSPTTQPFLMFASLNFQDSLTYKIAIGIPNKIFLNPEDQVQLDSISESLFFKSTLRGNYKFFAQQVLDIKESFSNSNFRERTGTPSLFFLNSSILNKSTPQEWNSELLIPIYEISADSLKVE